MHNEVVSLIVLNCSTQYEREKRERERERERERVRTGYGILEKLWNFEKEIPYMEKL